MFRLLLSTTALLTLQTAWGQGFQVRFLANSSPVAKYSIYRSTDPASTGTKVGEVLPQAGDTLSYSDGDVTAGKAYYYSVTSTNLTGAESGFSSPSAVAYPVLNLPDTLMSAQGVMAARFTLDPKMHPLMGIAPLDFTIDGASPLNIAWDEGSRTVILTSKLGKFESVKVKIRASYYGQFSVVDSAVVVINAIAAGIRDARGNAFVAPSVPALFRPGVERALVFSHLPAQGELEIVTFKGEVALRKKLSSPDGEFAWDGAGAGSQTFSYFVRDDAGRLAGKGRFRLQR